MPARKRKASRIRPVSRWRTCSLGSARRRRSKKGRRRRNVRCAGSPRLISRKPAGSVAASVMSPLPKGLGSLLKAMHKGTEHVGKLPQRAHREVERDDRMRALNENLQKAVADENYESAAALRDQIKQLEHEKAV